jgi:basic amino acid/polyamine antiporter, APA family
MFLNLVSFGSFWSIIYAVTYAPLYGGDPAVSLLLTAPGILALLGVYYIFNTSMPRSGGDYVYVSRILNPAVGLAANFVGWAIFLWFWIGDAASVFSSEGLSQILSVYHGLSGATWAGSLASWFPVPINNFALGTFVIVIFALLVIGSRGVYYRMQNILMSVAVIGIAITAILLVYSVFDPSSFVNSFNSYANHVGAGLTPNAYDNISAAGAAVALPHSPSNLSASLLLVPLWFTVLFWVFSSNYLGGELKNASHTAGKAMFTAFGISFASTLIILEAAYYGLGYNFLAGIDYIYYGYLPNTLGATPNLGLIVGILSNNSLIVIFLGVGIVSGFLLVAPWGMTIMSRILFSYSFDRLVPSSLADVNSRFSTPVKAILVAAIGGEIMLVFLSGILGGTTSSTALALYSYAAIGDIGITFTIVGITAIIFPYRKKQLYETASSVKRKIAGVPVITWLGLITLVYSVATVVWYTYDQNFYFFGCPAGGVVACDYNDFLILLAVLFIATVAYYFGVSAYRKRRGFIMAGAFAEIPPE